MWIPESWKRTWMHRGQAIPHRGEHRPAETKPHGREMSGHYLLLHTYLAERYADTVVLTFAQIEDVLGFALPAHARQRAEWWTNAPTDEATRNHSDSWVLADRTAAPNLAARTVAFDRIL